MAEIDMKLLTMVESSVIAVSSLVCLFSLAAKHHHHHIITAYQHQQVVVKGTVAESDVLYDDKKRRGVYEATTLTLIGTSLLASSRTVVFRRGKGSDPLVVRLNVR